MVYLIILAFISGVAMDVTWTLGVWAVAKHKPKTAAHMAVLIYVCTAVSTLLLIHGEWMPVIAFVAGSWVGTYSTVRWWTK